MSWFSFNSLVCWQITLTLLHVSWIGLMIGLIAALANHVLRNSAASRRYWLNFASLLMFALSLPVTLAVVRSVTAEAPSAVLVEETPLVEVADLAPRILDESKSFSPPVDASEFAPIQPPESSEIAEILPTFATPTPVAATPSAWESASSIAHTAAPFVAILYAIGVALMFAKLAFGVRVSRRLRSASQPVTDATILARLAEQAKKLSLRITPVVAYCEHTAVPIVVGLLRPMILIPAAMVNGLTIEQLESVLTHELAHLRRRDHLMIVVQRVLEAILFFHPVTWYLSQRLHDDRETSCDDLVLSIGGDRLQYAQSLLRVAELRLASQSHQKHIALAADGQRPSKLRQRIARLLGDTEGDSVRVGSVWLLTILVGTFIAGIWTLTATSQPVAASIADEARIQTEESRKLIYQALASVRSIKTAHVKFRIARPGTEFRKTLDPKFVRQMIEDNDLVQSPDNLRRVLESFVSDAGEIVEQPWSNVDLYREGKRVRTTTSSANHGPDEFVEDEGLSLRWDAANWQMNITPIAKERHYQETLDQFLSPDDDLLNGADGSISMFRYLKRFRGEGSARSMTTDPQTDNVLEITIFHPADEVKTEYLRLGWKKCDDQIWFPTVVAELNFENGNLSRCQFIIIEQAVFNKPLPAGIFQLGAPAGSLIIDKRAGDSAGGTINRDVFDVTSVEQVRAAAMPLDKESTATAQIEDAATLTLSGVVALQQSELPRVWSPNGTPIERPAEWPEPIRVLSQAEPTHGYIFESTGLQDGQAVAWRTADTEGMSKANVIPSLSELIPVRIGITGTFADQKTVTLRAGITTADWGPWRSIKADDSLEEVTPAAPFAELYRRVKPDTYSSDREVGLVLEGIEGIDNQAQHEVVAVMKNGERQQRSGSGYENGKGVVTFFRLSPDDVDHLEYRLRPYIHWVTFENVSLQPGEKTSVKIHVNSLPNNAGKPTKDSAHVRDIHGNRPVATGPVNGVDDPRLSSIAEQINQIGQAVLQKLQKETADFLNNFQRQQLISDMKLRLAEHVSVPLAAPDFERVLSAIGNSSKGPNRIKFAREDIFMTHFALLEWRIWVGMDPLKLTPAEIARREAQREWFRAHIKAQPAPFEGRQIYSSKSGKPVELTFIEYDLLQYEELLSDPTYPFLFFPFSDEDFEALKASLKLTPSNGFASTRIYDEYERAHRSKVEQRWHYLDDKGSAIWGDGTEFLKGFADDTVADADLPDAGPSGMEPETKKQVLTPAKKIYMAPPKDALIKLLGTNVDLNAARKNSAGLQYTTIGPIPDQEWEPVALEEAYDVVLTGMKENFGRIKTWSGECQEIFVNRDKSVMKEKSHLVRFELDVSTSKGGAIQTASKDWSCPVAAFDTQELTVFDRIAQSDAATDAAQQFHAEAIFYTPFFLGRQNKLHWDRIALYLKHFRDTDTPESERFVIAYRAKDQSSGMWRIDAAYIGNRDKFLVSQIISGLQGFNVLRETSLYVLSDAKTLLSGEVLQSYSETDGVFVPSERLEREFEPRTENLRIVHLQRITRSVVNQPLEPLPALTPLPQNPRNSSSSFEEDKPYDRAIDASVPTDSETNADSQAPDKVPQQDTNPDTGTLLNSNQPIKIIGHVHDIHGKPVSGANVSYPLFSNGIVERKPIRTLTDENGRFELSALSESLKFYPDLWVWHEGFSISNASVTRYEPGSVENLDVTLPPLSSVKIYIEDPEGRRVRNAKVYPAKVRMPNVTHPVDGIFGLCSFLPDEELKEFVARTTDENGNVELVNLPVAVLNSVGVTSENYGTQEFDVERLSIPMTLPLAPVGEITGNAPAGTRVFMKSVRHGHSVPVEGRADVVADADGKFEVKALLAGQVTITPRNSEHPEWLMEVQSAKLEPGSAITIDILPEATIPATGRLVHADSNLPIANARLALQVGTSARTHLGDVLTDADGKFTAHCSPGEQFVVYVSELPEPTMVYPKQQFQFRVPVESESFVAPDIEIREAKIWKGKLVDANNNPVAGKYVQHYFNNKDIDHPSRTTDAGEFTFAIDKDITPNRWAAVLKWDLRDKSGNAGYANDKFEVDAKVISHDPLVLQIQMPETVQGDPSMP